MNKDQRQNALVFEILQHFHILVHLFLVHLFLVQYSFILQQQS
jgi:hypothetical protein